MSSLTVRRLVPVAVVGGLLAAVAGAASLATPGLRSVPIPHPNASAAEASISAAQSSAGITPPAAPPQATAWQPPSWLSELVSAVCVLIAAAVIGFLVWQLIRMWLQTRAAKAAETLPSAARFETRREAVLDAVDQSIAELARPDGDSREAVITCWVRLEEVAGAAGTPRLPGDTPSDLVNRLLGEHQVSGQVLYDLAQLYRTARYSTQAIESDMRARARTAFTQLRAELAQSRSGALEHDPVLAGPRAAVSGASDRRPRPSAPRDGS